ncbi:MAG: hypothetical protein KDB27_14110 [Planctomycetales bacterium]|nr:hypothetical protein [Planctomycetales bacterium]
MQNEIWKKAAFNHLPDLRETIEEAKSEIDLWQSLKEYIADNPEEAKPVFDFAWWCFSNSGQHSFRYEVEAYFYEDLPVFSDLRPLLLRFITPTQFTELSCAFGTRVNLDELTELCSDFAEYKKRSPS